MLNRPVWRSLENISMLRSELVTFLTSLVVCAWKARKNICQQSIAGVLRLRATSRPLCDRSARRFAQDDAFVGASKNWKKRKGDILWRCRPLLSDLSGIRFGFQITMSFGAELFSVTTDTARSSRTIPFSQPCKSFLGATHEARFRVSSSPFVYSLLLEDFSSVVFDITRNLLVCGHPQRFCSVEIMYLLWKCQNGTIRAYLW